MSVAELKKQVASNWQSVPDVVELCSKILDFMASTPPERLRMLTFRSFANATHRAKIDTDLLTAIQILSSSRLAVLDVKALYVGDDVDEAGLLLSDEEFAHAQKTGELAHPETGELVEDAGAHILPFFVPSASFLEESKAS
jgi:hypothetical protein